MNATATDSLSDTLATTVVLIASLTAHFTGLQIDGYCGILVGLFYLLRRLLRCQRYGQPPAWAGT